MFDPHRLEAGFWALASAFAFGALRFGVAVFGTPPPDKRGILRAVFEWLVAPPCAFLISYAIAAPVAAWLTGIMPFMPHGYQVDPLMAGIALGTISVKTLTALYDEALDRLRKMIAGGAQ